jgi:DNA primase
MQKLTVVQTKALELTGLDESKKSPKGWIYGKCPFCGHDWKFGIKFNQNKLIYKNDLSFNCFRGSCGKKGSEYELFKHYNVLYLLNDKQSIDKVDTLSSELDTTPYSQKEIPKQHSETRDYPIGWYRVFDHPYLRERGWEDWQFQTYHVGVSEMFFKLKDHIIILIIEDGENKGFVARSTKDSNWIDQHNREVKEYNEKCLPSERKRFHPKYENESGVFFEELLFGIDEVTDRTETVIIVEGPLDKSNTDKQLKLNQSDTVKCLCTFGKKISETQMFKIKRKGVNNILLLYDPDAIDSSKQFGFELERYFKVKISVHESKDPGEMLTEDFQDVIASAKDPINFYANIVQSVL